MLCRRCAPRPAEVFDPEDADRDDLFELLDDDLKDLSDDG